MSEAKISLEELKAAINELEARSSDVSVRVEVGDRRVKISCMDKQDNQLEAVLYEDGKLGAQFRMTHRLMFMKDKKGNL